MLAVIVASHIRLRAMITVLNRDAKHRDAGRVDHRSRLLTYMGFMYSADADGRGHLIFFF